MHAFGRREVGGSPAGILFCHGCLNCVSTRLVGWFSGISTVWHMVGTVAIIIILPSVAPTHKSGSYVFTNFDVWQTEPDGITNNG